MVQRTFRALQDLGLPALSHLGLYRLGMQSGYYRWRLPIRSWSQVELPRLMQWGGPASFVAHRAVGTGAPIFGLKVHPDQIPQEGRDGIFAKADAIARGSFSLFGLDDIRLGFPPDWHAFAPLAGIKGDVTVSAVRHWSQYQIEALPHDVKLLWEASRFGWVFPLAQAYALSKDPVYFEVFWKLYCTWLDDNQPQAGLHWYSAQEVAIRLMALLFAACTFADELDTRPEQWIDLLKGIAVHVGRIPPTLAYARAQNNNHLLLESAALYMTGLAFPEFYQAAAWKRKGRRQFENGIAAQVFADGGYVQHSSQYQRLALQAGILVAHGAKVLDEPLEETSLQALRRMTVCLAALVEPEHGAVPNFGPNDGAMLFHLSNRPFEDFRPTIQAAGKLLHGYTCYPAGEWDDLAMWLGIEDDGQGTSFRVPDDYPQAGLHLAKRDALKVIFRGVSFENRPGHSDQLHLDIWYEGVNLARDPGTYLYNGSPPWDNALAGVWCHNTIMIDGEEPMLRGGRFLWLDWSQAYIRRYKNGPYGSPEVLFGSHHAPRWPGTLHQRSVAVLGSGLIVADDVLGEGEHRIALNWNLADLDWELEGSTIALRHGRAVSRLTWTADTGTWGLYRAGTCVAGVPSVDDPQLHGWHATTYASKSPALQLVVHSRGALPLRITSTWTFNQVDRDELVIQWRDITEDQVAFKGIRWGAEEWKI